MVVVVALIGIMGTVAVAYLGGSSSQAKLRDVARMFVANLRSARGLSTSGTLVGGARARFAGIEILSSTQYRIFADADAAAGGEITVHTVDFVQEHQENVSITAPAVGTQLRFNSQGVLQGGGAGLITVHDARSGEEADISVSGVGFPHILAMRM